MDADQFDRLTRRVGLAAPRRAVLAAAALVPALEALGKKRKKKKCKKTSEVCAGRCGAVSFKCKKKKKSIDCGACPAACDVCAAGCAFTTVQAAIDAAGADATITICAGTYTENLSIEESLTLEGAGQGADPATNTILHGDGTASVVKATTGSVTLRSLRITGGDSPSGGGLLLEVGTVTLTDSEVSGNRAGSGGGIYCYNGTLVLNNTNVTGNHAEGDGGGIYNHSCGITLDEASNIAGNHAAFDGGGVYNDGVIICAAETITSNTEGDPPVADNCDDVSSGIGCDACE